MNVISFLKAELDKHKTEVFFSLDKRLTVRDIILDALVKNEVNADYTTSLDNEVVTIEDDNGKHKPIHFSTRLNKTLEVLCNGKAFYRFAE